MRQCLVNHRFGSLVYPDVDLFMCTEAVALGITETGKDIRNLNIQMAGKIYTWNI